MTPHPPSVNLDKSLFLVNINSFYPVELLDHFKQKAAYKTSSRGKLCFQRMSDMIIIIIIRLKRSSHPQNVAILLSFFRFALPELIFKICPLRI